MKYKACVMPHHEYVDIKLGIMHVEIPCCQEIYIS